MPKFLEDLCKAFENSNCPVLIRTVDDGSGEEEASKMQSLVARLQMHYDFLLDPLLVQKNQGKGGAIYSGWDTASLDEFRWVAFVDADGAITPEETLRFLNLATEENEQKKTCLWSIRVKGEGKDINRTLIRNFLGNVFRIIVKCLFNIPVKDTQCGLKCIPLEGYQEVRNNLTEKRFVFDVELASHLVRKKYKLQQIPIDWQESPGSTVKITSAFRMAFSLIIIRLKLFLNLR